jgi:hypothetical protein
MTPENALPGRYSFNDMLAASWNTGAVAASDRQRLAPVIPRFACDADSGIAYVVTSWSW